MLEIEFRNFIVQCQAIVALQFLVDFFFFLFLVILRRIRKFDAQCFRQYP